MYPSRLSLVLLPVQQALQLSTLVDSLRRFAAIYKAAWHVRFKLQVRRLRRGHRHLASFEYCGSCASWKRP